jgi:uncharacterized protein YkwD
MRRILLSLTATALAFTAVVVSAGIAEARPAATRTEGAALAAAPAATSAAAVTTAPEELIQDLYARLNAERRAAGVAELAFSEEAYAVALERAADMAANGYFAHVSPSGIGPIELLKRHGIAYGWMGENIGMCTHPLAQVAGVLHQAWVTSAGHRENMLNANYGRVGIAVVSADGTFYAAQIFLD